MRLTIRSFEKPESDALITRLSEDASGNQVTSPWRDIKLTADGKGLLFTSAQSDLVEGDTNGVTDVFFKNLTTGAITRVSTGTKGEEADSNCGNAQISADGRYVVFTSDSQTLIPGEGYFFDEDVFVKDLSNGTLRRVSEGTEEGVLIENSNNATISPDGQFVVFRSTAKLIPDSNVELSGSLLMRNLTDWSLTVVSTNAKGEPANGSNYDARFSADGQHLFFRSNASNLVPEGSAMPEDLYVKDLQTKVVQKINVKADGTRMSGFTSFYGFSSNGRYALLGSSDGSLDPKDDNGVGDLFVKDLQLGTIRLVSSRADGTVGNGASVQGSISPDGNYVVFESEATDLVDGDSHGQRDIFLKDLSTQELKLISANENGQFGNGYSSNAQFSPDGRYIIFSSASDNLVPGDANGRADIFMMDTWYEPQPTDRVVTQLEVGSASRVTVAWGDGTSTTQVPAGGTVTMDHTYDARGIKAATVTLTEGALTWTVPHRIDVDATTMVRNTALTDTLSGGAGNDVLTGDAFANLLIANDGSDALNGDAGNDTLDGGYGNDGLSGGAGSDRLLAGDGNDSLNGDADDDVLDGGNGNDGMNGGYGNDMLQGGAGNDVLSAGAGDDRLHGGRGLDKLTGGAGRDVFAFDDKETGTSKKMADYIYDFSGRQRDRIDLKAVDAVSSKRGDQKFVFIGKSAFTKAGQVRYEKTKKETYVYLNTDKDKAAEAVIKLKGSIDLQKGWFVL